MSFHKNNLTTASTRLHKYENIFSPSIFYKISISKNEHFIFGVIYRSPNCTDQDYENLNNLIEQISNEHAFPKENIIIVGDFNYPDIDWCSESCTKDFNHKSTKFLTLTQKCFLTQHISEPTHFRALQTPTLIDLVLSNNPDLLKDIKQHPPFGKSHHMILCFNIDIFLPPPNKEKTNEIFKYQMNKGNYNGMRKFLGDQDWDREILKEDVSVDACWNTIADTINTAKSKFIPKRKNKKRTCKRQGSRIFYSFPDYPF